MVVAQTTIERSRPRCRSRQGRPRHTGPGCWLRSRRRTGCCRQQQREGAHDAGRGEEDGAGDAEQVAEAQPRAAAPDGHDARHRDRDQGAAEDLEGATETGQVRRPRICSARSEPPRCRSRRLLPPASGSRRACRGCGAGQRGRQAWRGREEAPTQYAVGCPSAGPVTARQRASPAWVRRRGRGRCLVQPGWLRGRRPGGPPSSCRPW